MSIWVVFVSMSENRRNEHSLSSYSPDCKSFVSLPMEMTMSHPVVLVEACEGLGHRCMRTERVADSANDVISVAFTHSSIR